MRKYIHIFFAAFLVIFISGCTNQSVTETPEKKAVSIRNAINTNNFAFLANSISLPIILSKQDWKTADDGYGFVFGSKNTLVANNTEELDGIFSILKNVEIEGDYPLEQGFNLIDFTDEFSGIEYYWEPLELFVFFRGQGDVEHIVVLGLDKKSLKLRAIYIN
ncbi:hypothetical protein [Colwellia psychrerythraea]|uniref:Lipoprotein n=1 Tax=Colwellia psychrerythraea TaxID=28229 RepID=A0A099KJM3_COLPS|nr:hypothetical protein [Colwellia psychrerythraea]KGJ89803.1 hypothetical protein GAB14E_3964 [Colwellia psychrerythraea]